MRFFAAIIFLALAATGCASRSQKQMQMQMAALASENAALKSRLAAQGRGVTIIGPVENSFVPWVMGLSLTQAITTANYLEPNAPKNIVITRGGESANLDATILLSGTVVPLEPGDIVEIHP